MQIGVMLICLVMIISIILLVLNTAGAVTNKPKVFIVSLFSNASILALFYHPGLYGVEYYFLNTLKIIPLMLLLIYLASHDRSYNWSYRAMCWIFALQIFTSSWHILSGLTSPYYDQLSIGSTLLELLILTGGCNGRIVRLVDRFWGNNGSHGCMAWVKFYYKEGRESSCPKD